MSQPSGPLQVPEEPSGREIWAIVLARWRTVVLIGGVLITAAAVAALLYPPRFSYSSAVEIAVVADRVEPAETVAVKLTETYLPQIRAEYAAAHPDQLGRVPRLDVRVPRGSALVVVESRGTTSSASLHHRLHEAAIALLEAEQARAVSVKRQTLEAGQAEARRRLEEQQDQLKVLDASAARIDATERLLQRQRASLRDTLARAERERAAVAGSNPDTSAFLIMDQEILHTLDRLWALEERLSVGLDAERSAIAKAKADAARLRAAQQLAIEQAQRELNNLRPTRTLALARQSERPVGATPLVILGLGGIGGLTVGVFVAIIAGLIDRGHTGERPTREG